MGQNDKPFTYEDLDVYQAGLDLAEAVYRLTRDYPRHELYGMVSQMRRASVSISTNIAEGWGRGPGAANAQFVRISRGSMYEVEALVSLSKRLEYISDQQAQALRPLVLKCGKLIQAYLASLEKNLVRELRATYGLDASDEVEPPSG